MNVLSLHLEAMGSELFAKVLVDGRVVGRGGMAPYTAADLLITGALLPSDPPRRVSLAQCDCGGGGGCANHTVLISRVADVITWTDAQNVHGYYGRPILDDPGELDDDEDVTVDPIAAPDLTFDTDTYLATVHQATAAART